MNKTFKILAHPRLANAFEVLVYDEMQIVDAFSIVGETRDLAYQKALDFACKKLKEGHNATVSPSIT